MICCASIDGQSLGLFVDSLRAACRSDLYLCADALQFGASDREWRAGIRRHSFGRRKNRSRRPARR